MSSTTLGSFQIYTQLRYNRIMDIFEKLFPQNLYHSYAVEGDPVETAEALLSFLEIRGEIEKSSSDLLFQNYESLSMDDIPQIKNWHNRLGLGKGKKICILATKFINREAEQALLKIIEEPTEKTHFFIIVPDSSLLLPTILSRVHVVKTKLLKEDNSNIKEAAKFFLAYSLKDRIDHVALIVKNNKEVENSGALRHYATSLVNELEAQIYLKFKKNKKDENLQFILEELAKSRGYLSTPGASVKMILEHLALIL